jgi:purine-binding chemotaxis protein CheW
MTHIDLGRFESRGSRARVGDFLVIRVAGGVVRIPAATILEIMNPMPATKLPGAPVEVLGLLNYRGSPATIVDLPRVLGRGAVRETHRLVVLRWGDREVALAVDDVVGLTDSSDGSSPPPEVDLDVLFGSIF